MTMQVRCKSLHVSQPFPVKQQCEMTTIGVSFSERERLQLIFRISFWNKNLPLHI